MKPKDHYSIFSPEYQLILSLARIGRAVTEQQLLESKSEGEKALIKKALTTLVSDGFVKWEHGQITLTDNVENKPAATGAPGAGFGFALSRSIDDAAKKKIEQKEVPPKPKHLDAAKKKAEQKDAPLTPKQSDVAKPMMQTATPKTGKMIVPLAMLKMNTGLRRALINAGYKTLYEAYCETDANKLAADIGIKHFMELDELIEAIEKKPNSLQHLTKSGDLPKSSETSAGRASKPDATSVKKKAAVSKKIEAASKRSEVAIASKNEEKTCRVAPKKRDYPLPDKKFSRDLQGFEAKSRDALRSLIDHSETAIIAECFPKLILDLDSVVDCFVELFKYYDGKMRALRIAEAHFPNAFIVTVSYFASINYNGESLWKALFERLGALSKEVQESFKSVYYETVKLNRLPVFTAEDNDFRYFNTALLHGGFSESFWKPLWKDIIIPYAKDLKSSWALKRDGREILQKIKKGEGRYRLQREYAKRIIEKAPVTLLAPMLDAAVQVAVETLSRLNSGSFGMMASHGLSDAAMNALRNVLEEGVSRKKRLVYLPSAELRLDPIEGRIHLHWDAQKLPVSFAGKSVAYYVNGVLEIEQDFLASVGKCILPECEVTLCPSDRFDVELVLRDSDEGTTALSSMSQTFDRTRPGSFEFIRSADEVFRLRKSESRLRVTSVVAYLTKSELWVVPGQGMEEIDYFEAEEGWGGASIQLFEVAPGASGSIIEISTKKEIACWQEDYQVQIDRRHAIGRTRDKRDLFGFSYTEVGGNAALPEIIITTFDVDAIRDDLEILCFCDGVRISPQRQVYQDEEGYDLLSSGQMVITLGDAMAMPRYVREGEITVAQKSTGRPIVKYQFACVPIRGFGINALYREDERLMATYEFEAMDPLVVPDEDGDFEMERGDRYYFDAPLEDEKKYLSVRSEDNDSLDIQLTLAAVTVRIDESLIEIAEKRPLRILDDGAVDGKITILSQGRRHTRNVYVMMGETPLLYKKLSGNTAYSFNVFKDPERFRFDRSEYIGDLVLTLTHGEVHKGREIKPALADLVLARYATGLGLGAISVRSRSEGCCLRFDKPAPSDLRISFVAERRNKDLGFCDVAEGEKVAALPEAVVGHIKKKRRFW